MIHVDCEHCGNQFDVADTLAGGLANCTACGKATSVPGLRDPYYRLLQAVMATVGLFLVGLGWWIGGVPGAIGAGLATILVVWLIHLAL
jgi:hypothetical protein